MRHEIERWDAEEWLQKNKDIWNHPMVSDRTDKNGYEVADLMAEFANYILDKQKQKQLIIDIMNEDAKDGLYKQQTAVEWFFDNLKSHEIQAEHLSMYEQAKEMEKEQIIDAWMDGMEGILHKIAAEKYYNETYGDSK